MNHLPETSPYLDYQHTDDTAPHPLMKQGLEPVGGIRTCAMPGLAVMAGRFREARAVNR
jgi:hypothetical protein